MPREIIIPNQGKNVSKRLKVILAVTICAFVIGLLLPVSPPRVTKGSLNARLLLWLSERWALSKDTDEIFLQEGRYTLCSEYGVYAIVTSQSCETNSSPLIVAEVRYSSLDEGLVSVRVDSGKSYILNPDNGEFCESASTVSIDYSTWKRVNVCLFVSDQ